MRKIADKNHNVLCYNTINNQFMDADILDVDNLILIKCFIKSKGNRVYDIDGNGRNIDLNISEPPPGYYKFNPTDKITVFDLITKEVGQISKISLTNTQVEIKIQNNSGRLAFINIHTNKKVYWHKDLLCEYGIPSNYITSRRIQKL